MQHGYMIYAKHGPYWKVQLSQLMVSVMVILEFFLVYVLFLRKDVDIWAQYPL